MGEMAIMKAAKDTMLASVTPARTHCAFFWFISRVKVGRRSLLISAHLWLSLNIHDLRLLHSACVIEQHLCYDPGCHSLMSNEVLVGVIEGLTVDS